MKTARIITLGCKTNQYEGEALGRALAALGVRVDESAAPDIAVVNTCTVTQRADRRARQAVMKLAREHPAASIYVTGCYAARAAAELAALPGVAGVCFGKSEILEVIARNEHLALPEPELFQQAICNLQHATPSRHGRAYLKIQDGCDAFCAYCIVPLVRPTLRSEPLDAILREAREIVAAGFLEIVLTGIHLGRYGADRSDGLTLLDVVREVAKTPGLARLRLSSIEMPEVADELIEFMAANPILCPHLHLPLQSGDPGVLAAMNRRYTPGRYLATLRRVRERIGDAAITTDVIVGFPGESDEAFENTLRVVREARFSKVHVFPFSARPGTQADRMPRRLPQRVVTRRKKQLIALADELALEYARRFVNQTVDVVVETVQRDAGGRGVATGLTERYLRVSFPGEEDLIDRRVSVRVETASAQLLVGCLADGPPCEPEGETP